MRETWRGHGGDCGDDVAAAGASLNDYPVAVAADDGGCCDDDIDDCVMTN